MLNKQFSDRLNKELDNIGLPCLSNERKRAFSRLMRVNPFKAGCILDGDIPDEDFLDTLAVELEVNPEWLIGKSEQRAIKKYKRS